MNPKRHFTRAHAVFNVFRCHCGAEAEVNAHAHARAYALHTDEALLYHTRLSAAVVYAAVPYRALQNQSPVFA